MSTSSKGDGDSCFGAVVILMVVCMMLATGSILYPLAVICWIFFGIPAAWNIIVSQTFGGTIADEVCRVCWIIFVACMGLFLINMIF